jgi:3-hydroxyisobutyrate dehydrogenase-like beta-hydroxyacid dehydrogenase
MKIGFIGLGQMGQGIAGNLIKAGHEVTVFNRSAEKAAPLVALGARLAENPAGASGGDIVMTMLADDQAAEAVVFGDNGILSVPEPALHVSMSTISVSLAERLAAAQARKFVSAPVFGRPDAAAAGKLFVVAAGPAAALKICAPVFGVIGQRTFDLGEAASAANLVKLSGNFLIASVIESLGEAIALVSKAGVDKRDYLELLTSTLFSAPVYKNYGALIVEQTFSPAGFAAPLGLKDMRLALAAAEGLQVAMPVASLLRDRFITLLATGGGDLDWSAIGQLAARDSGQ